MQKYKSVHYRNKMKRFSLSPPCSVTADTLKAAAKKLKAEIGRSELSPEVVGVLKDLVQTSYTRGRSVRKLNEGDSLTGGLMPQLSYEGAVNDVVQEKVPEGQTKLAFGLANFGYHKGYKSSGEKPMPAEITEIVKALDRSYGKRR